MFSNQKVAKSSNNIFYCDCCDYSTSKKFNYYKHLSTPKHTKSMASNDSVEKVAKSSNQQYSCVYCEKTYKDNSGLWRHKKKCNTAKNTEDKTQEIVQYLMKENSEFKQLLIDQSKQMAEISCKAIDNAGHNNINSNNKTFNLQVFLNETCKNAINMSDFVNQLQVSISDLEETGKLGFAEGISKIFINGLKQMDMPDRPLHCSDLKRETIYIKNNNEWTKDSDENLLLVNAIKQVSNKNIKQISEWQKINPEYKDSSSKINDKYLKIVSESMSGSTKEECERNYKKIVKNIAKEIIIDKTIIS
jgi:hypothetical protein